MRQDFFSNEVRELFHAGRLSEAMDKCQEVLRDLRQMHGEQHPSVTHVMDDLARVYHEMGDNSAAMNITENILKMDCASLGEESADYVRNLTNLGFLNILAGRISVAEVMLDHALKLVQRLPLDEQCTRPTILMHIARLHRDRQEYATAERLLLEAGKQRLNEYNWAHPLYADVFHQLARLYLSMGRTSAAKSAINKALRIYNNSSQTQHPRYAKMLALLGDVQAKQGLIVDAKDSYVRALTILQLARPQQRMELSEIERRLSEVEK